jgi:hypothetical protein
MKPSEFIINHESKCRYIKNNCEIYLNGYDVRQNVNYIKIHLDKKFIDVNKLINKIKTEKQN